MNWPMAVPLNSSHAPPLALASEFSVAVAPFVVIARLSASRSVTPDAALTVSETVVLCVRLPHAVVVIAFRAGGGALRPDIVEPGLIAGIDHRADAEGSEEAAVVAGAVGAAVQMVAVQDAARVAADLAFDPAVHLLHFGQRP